MCISVWAASPAITYNLIHTTIKLQALKTSEGKFSNKPEKLPIFVLFSALLVKERLLGSRFGALPSTHCGIYKTTNKYSEKENKKCHINIQQKTCILLITKSMHRAHIHTEINSYGNHLKHFYCQTRVRNISEMDTVYNMCMIRIR